MSDTTPSGSPPPARSALTLVSAANERFFPGLRAALATAVAAASGRTDYAVHVLDGGLSEANWAELDSLLKTIAAIRGVGLTLNRTSASSPAFGGLPLRRGSPLAYARLVLPELMPGTRLVYLDSDVLCLRGVEEFWEALGPDVPVVAVTDPIQHIGRDAGLRHELRGRADRRLPYFNSGIIGINLGCWKDLDAPTEIRRLLSGGMELTYADQTLLNFLFRNRWRAVTGENNMVLSLEHCVDLATNPRPANLHFVGTAKPWFARMSKVQRLLPDLMFDEVDACLSGVVPAVRRTADPGSVISALRKGFWYRFHSPSRASTYRGAALEAEKAATIASGELWAAGTREVTPWFAPWTKGSLLNVFKDLNRPALQNRV